MIGGKVLGFVFCFFSLVFLVSFAYGATITCEIISPSGAVVATDTQTYADSGGCTGSWESCTYRNPSCEDNCADSCLFYDMCCSDCKYVCDKLGCVYICYAYTKPCYLSNPNCVEACDGGVCCTGPYQSTSCSASYEGCDEEGTYTWHVFTSEGYGDDLSGDYKTVECVPGTSEDLGPCGLCGILRRQCQSDCIWGSSDCEDEGECSPGDTESRSCGNCGTETRTCTSGCSWGGWGSCTGQGVCSPGQTRTEDCGNCGTRTQTCQSNCQWGNFGSCTGEGECSPGDTESRSCGNCGTETRTCQSNCQWGNWGSCQEGECSPGSVEDLGPCGNCGTSRRYCDINCNWGSPVCEDEGVCSPGDQQIGGLCGSCARWTQDCQVDCTWGSSYCPPEECTPGQIQWGSSCGNCGTNRRVCQSDCSWGGWSCYGEGVCSPGSVEDLGPCGNCGTQRRTCQEDCTWSSPSCEDEGVCSPGDTDTESCGNCGTRTMTCQEDCTWGSFGPCTGEGCDPSEPCCDINCQFEPDTLVCDTSTEQRCEGTGCGDNAQERTVKTYCSGTSTACDGQVVPDPWADLEDCGVMERCNGVTYTCEYDITCDAFPPSSSMDPLPEWTNKTSFDVSWDGSDGSGESGLKCFDVEYSTDGVSFNGWLTCTTETSETFGPSMPVTVTEGSTYYFRVRATDLMDNVEPWPSAPYVKTTVDMTPPDIIKQVYDQNGNPISGRIPITVTRVTIESSATDWISGVETHVLHYWVTEGGETIYNTVDCNPAAPYGGTSTCSVTLDFSEDIMIKYRIETIDRAGNSIFSSLFFVSTHLLANFATRHLYLAVHDIEFVEVQVRNLLKTPDTVIVDISDYELAEFMEIGDANVTNFGKRLTVYLEPGDEKIFIVKVTPTVPGTYTLTLNAMSTAELITDSDTLEILIGYPASFPGIDTFAVLVMVSLAVFAYFFSDKKHKRQ